MLCSSGRSRGPGHLCRPLCHKPGEWVCTADRPSGLPRGFRCAVACRSQERACSRDPVVSTLVRILYVMPAHTEVPKGMNLHRDGPLDLSLSVALFLPGDPNSKPQAAQGPWEVLEARVQGRPWPNPHHWTVGFGDRMWVSGPPSPAWESHDVADSPSLRREAVPPPLPARRSPVFCSKTASS